MSHLNATDRYTEVFFNALVKEGAERAGEGTLTGDNEEHEVAGKNSDQLHEDAERAKGNIDAPWGESDGKANRPKEQFSDVAYKGFIDSRQKILDELFADKGKAQANAQAVVGQQLTHAAGGNYETMNPMLEPQAKQSSVRTLRELVDAIK